MPKRHLLALLFLLLTTAGCAIRPEREATHTVVLVSIDGLPADVVGSGRMPTLDAIAGEGVRAAWVNPSYPTLTFPNHYTLVTGLRPDHHGIVHNDIRDPALGRFVSKQESARDGRWWGGEPIWNTLQRQGGIAATMYWPGSEAAINGMRPRHSRRFDGTLPVAARVDQLLQWLDLPPAERPALLTLYLEQYDVAAHAAAMQSPRAMQALADIDAGLARLREGLLARGMEDRVNLIVLSDHGMADARAADLIYLDDRVQLDTIDLEYAAEVTGLTPRAGHEQEVERALLGRHGHLQCWRKGELPTAWHFGRNPRIPAIVCQADLGWRVWLHRVPPPAPLKATHGFAPEEPAMRAMFVARGPSFRAGTRIPAFDNVDVYPLLARLLHIVPAPNDGRIDAFVPALRDEH